MGNDKSDMQKEAEKRMAIYAEALRGYKRTRDPDKVKVGELVKYARGVGRSIRQFAEELGVSPSTISRVENGKAAGVSEELLVKVAEHTDPDSDVSLEELLAANGLTKDPHREFYDKRKEFENTSKEVIKNELFRADHSCLNASETKIPSLGRIAVPGLKIRTDAIGEGVWFFNFMYMGGIADETRLHMASFRVIDRLLAFMAIFYCGSREVIKASIVVDNEEVFELLKETLVKNLTGD